MIEHTLSIIKPNAIAKNLIGDIYHRFETARFKIIGAKMVKLTTEQAEGFYIEHKDRSFFNNLVRFMISGPIMVSVLEGNQVIKRHRDLMGATNPHDALSGTLRADYGDSWTENTIHGSKCYDSAVREITYFFSEYEIYSSIKI